MAFSPLPPGTIMAYGGPTAPSGWLLCDGSAVSRTLYAGLFSALGGAWGTGDGSTTFNLPDLRGRFLRGVDGAANRDPDKTTRTASASGGNTGNTVGSVQGDATAVKGLSNASSSVTATAAATGSGTLTSHSHGVTDGGHVHSIAHDHGAFTSGAGSAHNHGAGSYATSIGLSGSAPSLTGSTTFASSTHKHLGTTGVSDQKYFVRTNGGQITSVSNSPLGSSNTYSGSGNIDVSYTGNNDANASVGITGGSYSLTGANTVSGTSADESAHTHSIDVPNFTGNSTSATTGLSVNTANIDHTHSVSGTAAAQALSGDSETRPLNANVNYIIKV